jgi:hypothetical protein
MANAENLLPPSFEDLEPLVEEGWSLDTWTARNARRYGSTMEELRSFYDRLMARAEDVLSYLAKIDLEDLEPRDLRLLQLMLMLPEVSFPVERHGQPAAPEGVNTTRFPQWDPRSPELVP